MRCVLRSKIHNATVTHANVGYVGSITIDVTLLKKSGIWVGEKVLVVSNTTGARLETYVIEGEENSGMIAINGSAAHLIQRSESIIIMAFELTDTPIKPTVLLVDHQNHLIQSL